MKKIGIDWKTVEELVKDILIKYPFTRDSDSLLECMIVQELGYGDHTFTDVMTNRKEYNIPKLATIERARRKLQEKHIELRASKEVEKERFNLQNEYEEYALDKTLL